MSKSVIFIAFNFLASSNSYGVNCQSILKVESNVVLIADFRKKLTITPERAARELDSFLMLWDEVPEKLNQDDALNVLTLVRVVLESKAIFLTHLDIKGYRFIAGKILTSKINMVLNGAHLSMRSEFMDHLVFHAVYSFRSGGDSKSLTDAQGYLRAFFFERGHQSNPIFVTLTKRLVEAARQKLAGDETI